MSLKVNSMKLIELRCPNCHAEVKVNEDLDTAFCNYCGAQFRVEDENETKEERIIKAKAKVEEQSKDAERKYYASEDYAKKLNAESSENARKIILPLIFMSFVMVFTQQIISLNAAKERNLKDNMSCTMENKEYIIVMEKGKDISCASCTDEMLELFNSKYVDKDSVSITKSNIKSYFSNNGGNCRD